MKYLSLIIYCLFTSIVFLQNDEGAVFDFDKKAGILSKEGSKYISMYYGFPHIEKAWQTASLKAYTSSNSSIQNIISRGFGPIGVKGEYFVTDIIAVGFDLMYNKYSIYFDDIYQVYDPIFTYLIDKVDEYKFTMERLRIHFRANFHFKVKNPLIQIYGGVGLGLNYRNIFFRKNGEKESEITNYLEKSTLVLPISSRVCFGYRQFIKNNFALSFEAGLGGPLFSVGLAHKF